MNYYCLFVKTGSEEKIQQQSQKSLDAGLYGFGGKFYVFKKLMRLKSGKIYKDVFFPGYIFLETECGDPAKLVLLKKEGGIGGFLPKAESPERLQGNDFRIIENLMTFGDTIGFARARFDKDDRIVITNPLFNDAHGRVISVNRRNHRVKVLVNAFGSEKVYDLTYYDIEKEEWSQDEKEALK